MNDEVDPRLEFASTLPSSLYFDPAIYQREKERIFWNSWQYAARAEELPQIGSYLATEIQGEPIFLVRNAQGVQCFSNVCRHRGSLLLAGAGTSKVVVCPYHAWTYSLEGRLIGQPEFENVQNWDRRSVCLPQYAVKEWGPFFFVHLGEPKLDFSTVLGRIPVDIETRGFNLASYRFLLRKDYIVNCNWKAYVDNYLEGYHIPSVHPQLNSEIDYAQYRIDTFDYYSSQYVPLKPVPDSRRESRAYDPGQGATDPLYYWIFPNFMLNIYPDNMSTNIIVPLATDKTLTIFEWFVPKSLGVVSSERGEELAAFSDQVQQEDIRICENVQKGLRSRTYSRGRFSVKRENGVHHFHQLLATALK